MHANLLYRVRYSYLVSLPCFRVALSLPMPSDSPLLLPPTSPLLFVLCRILCHPGLCSVRPSTIYRPLYHMYHHQHRLIPCTLPLLLMYAAYYDYDYECDVSFSQPS
ncbi:hypothetical protein B0H10DRAFT_739376 [Mycena sp. CBHHK59/15]|nr:hypothetical protein B0H10DRAFT_739376 [Mycena sp. CBHHK59/15]